MLVATADGGGTKTPTAAAPGRYGSVGRDLVQHCINDALVQGAEPLFFLDYVGVGKLRPERVAALIVGLAEACKDHGLTLLGGETAEMPGVYPEEEFDLVGTLVGVVERAHLIDGTKVVPGDRLIGLPSVGLHTNGYSLARRILDERMRLGWDDAFPGAGGASVADVMLEPHRCYLEPLRPFLKDPALHALAHITGGGVAGNLPRVLHGLGARVSRAAVPPLNVFEQLVAAGGVERDEAWRAFNMGVGMILVVSASEAGRLEASLRANGEAPFAMGEICDQIDGVAWLD